MTGGLRNVSIGDPLFVEISWLGAPIGAELDAPEQMPCGATGIGLHGAHLTRYHGTLLGPPECDLRIIGH